MTGRRNDPQGLRRRILDAAFDRFVARGYAATPLQDLRAESGATGGAFAHHFPTKKALALAVIEDRVAEAVARAWIEPVERAPTAREGVALAFDRIAAGLEAQGEVRGCPLNTLALEVAGQDAELSAAAAALFARWRGAIAAKLRADLGAGRLRPLDPEAAAAFVVAAYSGAMAQARAAQDPSLLRLCAAETDRWLAAGG